MMLRQRKRKRSLSQRRALTLSSFVSTLAKVEVEAQRTNDVTLQGVVILCRAFADKLRDDAAIS